MCGIFGMIGTPWRDGAPAALATLSSRGPDARELEDFPGGACLGHTRLAVIDLSGGRQPMVSPDGRHALVFNGEIYNFQSLRDELSALGYIFATRSDTEVLLHGWRAWGEGVVARLDGMFAFAVWDTEERRLFAARDRTGIKPFFYAQVAGGFIFASTMAPFLALPEFPRQLDPEGLRDYLAFQAPVAPRTLLADIRVLPPASCLDFSAAADKLSLRTYWQIPRPGKDGASFAERVARTDELLRQAVRSQLVADVPLGAFLSGGIDSSLMVHYMAEAGASPLRTFNVRFTEAAFDETSAALAVAGKYGTDHTVLPAPAIDGPRLVEILQALDQPLGDPAYVTTAELSRQTRQHVTVAISGDGGDELFAGYSRYREVQSRYPDSGLRRLIRWGVKHGVLPGQLLRRGLAGRDMLLYRRVEMGPFDPSRKGLGGLLAREILEKCRPEGTLERWQELLGPSPAGVAELMRADLWTYLSEDCLTKTDRASMAHSLEVRVPFLANTVLDEVLTWPAETHYDGGGGKAILRELARRHLPEIVWNRPKHGFSVPVRQYFNGPWQEVGDHYFSRAAELAPFLRADACRAIWAGAREGRVSRRLAYSILVLLVWQERLGRPRTIAGYV